MVLVWLSAECVDLDGKKRLLDILRSVDGDSGFWLCWDSYILGLTFESLLICDACSTEFYSHKKFGKKRSGKELGPR